MLSGRVCGLKAGRSFFQSLLVVEEAGDAHAQLGADFVGVVAVHQPVGNALGKGVHGLALPPKHLRGASRGEERRAATGGRRQRASGGAPAARAQRGPALPEAK